MADPPRDPETASGDAAANEPGRRSAPATPRWVKAFGIIALIFILLGALQLLLGVQHGPGLHAPSSDGGGQMPIVSRDAASARLGAPADAYGAARTIEVTDPGADHDKARNARHCGQLTTAHEGQRA